MSFKSGFESRERERESQFNTAGGSELQVRGVAVLNDRLANDEKTAYKNKEIHHNRGATQYAFLTSAFVNKKLPACYCLICLKIKKINQGNRMHCTYYQRALKGSSVTIVQDIKQV